MVGLRVAPGLTLPAEAVTQTFGILAKRGAGKTHTASVMAEEMARLGLPFVAADPIGVWWGLRAAADGVEEGLPIAVLGGEHGDLPLEKDAGAVVADLVVDERVSCVLDLSLFRKGEAIKFMTAFAERLYHRNREPLHLFLDEADAWAPQRTMRGEGQERLLGAIEDFVRRGRARGIGATLITQRPAVLNKNVLTQIETLVVHRIVSPQDRKAIDEWVNVHADAEAKAQVTATLASLDIGESWWWSPGWLDILKRVKVRERHTFDSSATPKAGQRRREPKTLADVDLGALEQRMAATVERKKQNDPAELRRQIRGLEAELKKKPEASVEVKRVEVPVLPDGHADRLAELHEKVDRAAHDLLEVRAGLQFLAEDAGKVPSAMAQQLADEVRKPPAAPRPAPRQPAPAPAANGDVQLKKGARAMLMELAAYHPGTMSRTQLATAIGIKSKGTTFSSYLSNLRTAGLLVEDGDRLTVPESVFDTFGIEKIEPRTPEELLAMWRSKLKKCAREMLDALVAVYPQGLERLDLAERLEINPSGTTLSSYLSNLRTNELITETGSTVYVSEHLV